MLSRISSRAALGSEGKEAIANRRVAQRGLKRFSAHHIYRTFEQAGNKLLQIDISIYVPYRVRIDVDQYIDVTVGTSLTTRQRTEQRHVKYPAGSQFSFVKAQCSEGIFSTH